MIPNVRSAALALAAFTAGCGDGKGGAADPTVLRLGHFPNVTHAQALVARAKSRQGEGKGTGWFEERLGPGMRVEWYTYNAGPSAMEALVAGSIDATYVGPNPALNAHLRSKGAEVRVLAGSMRGGAALVVRADGGLTKPADFRGKKVATPQLGNTQDVACRAWLREGGLEVTPTGGDLSVLPTANPDQLALFAKGDLDGVWTVEPWVSRLEREAGGKVLVSEDDSITTVLVASAQLVATRPEIAKKLAAAHRELTEWVAAHPDEAQALVREELRAETRQEMSPELLRHCWGRLRFDVSISVADFEKFVRAAQSVGYLQDAGDLSRLVPGGP